MAALAGLYEWRRNGGLRIHFRGWRGEGEPRAVAEAYKLSPPVKLCNRRPASAIEPLSEG